MRAHTIAALTLLMGAVGPAYASAVVATRAGAFLPPVVGPMPIAEAQRLLQTFHSMPLGGDFRGNWPLSVLSKVDVASPHHRAVLVALRSALAQNHDGTQKNVAAHAQWLVELNVKAAMDASQRDDASEQDLVHSIQAMRKLGAVTAYLDSSQWGDLDSRIQRAQARLLALRGAQALIQQGRASEGAPDVAPASGGASLRREWHWGTREVEERARIRHMLRIAGTQGEREWMGLDAVLTAVPSLEFDSARLLAIEPLGKWLLAEGSGNASDMEGAENLDGSPMDRHLRDLIRSLETLALDSSSVAVKEGVTRALALAAAGVPNAAFQAEIGRAMNNVLKSAANRRDARVPRPVVAVQ